MLTQRITRRVFIGASVYIVSAPLFATIFNKAIEIHRVVDSGQFFDEHALTVLTDVAEIMIPKTETPGATDANVAAVLDGLMMTWAGSKTKQQYISVIEQIQEVAKSTYQADYIQLPLQQRELLITELDKTAFANKNTSLSASYRHLKEMIFHVYYSSEEANPDFVLIPGGYRGDITKSELQAIKTRGYL
ncbi:gluconate 2-dehydrogenase subunit 3 family protein [Paraglaciecola aquimarina]|uniref:Gluconate 2-dehydrogenase subunit 3 family protein n=1 Tax=Paraglaciecola aquimarina TaxID=1235557 RepID=A0ABU3SRD5_9ALTE|nr:gluconate 2-dehydrogenase subunit 3 family protein [Paraglaciecola aquimarina]MDU0352561.1 gluconate 2-dehydrogenase subunit 3 family protein [Paraglaciecola aquimarina]